ncbi:MAG: hypothetical protein R3285_09515 [Kiloniellales bacterium]|nr:hypothetical protein [Kiloniellales bacterium]
MDTPDEHGRWGLKQSHRWLEVGLRRCDPAAIEGARELSGLDLTEAKKLVDKLQGR